MIVLDTNVISELMRPQPHRRVVDWVAGHAPERLYTTSICRAEILFSLSSLPIGRRRAELAAAVFDEDFRGRVMAFDSVAAEHYARIVVARRAAGRPIEGFDALIAATTAAAGYGIATRDLGGFSGCGLDVVDPWQA